MGRAEIVIPPQTVQLRHTLPDGTWHVDWMLDLTGTDEGPLTTFRLERRLDELAPGDRLAATRIADHRRDYLGYEGEISDGRGHVERLAAGRIEALQSLGDTWGLLVLWQRDALPSHRQRLRLHRVEDDRWRVEIC
ncbi:MAG: hypothetical protein ACYTJ0_14260 [Planctomycetota bacterium]